MDKYIILNLVSKFAGILGSSLVSLSLIFQNSLPWITFKDEYFLPPDSKKVWEWVHYKLSPFLLSYRSESQGIVTEWYYRSNMTLVGILCLFGLIIGLVGVLLGKIKTTILGGFIILFSLIVFSTSLPGVYPYFAWGMGSKLVFYGFLLIMSSSALLILAKKVREREVLLDRLEETWKEG
jgi:hypothetical protein